MQLSDIVNQLEQDGVAQTGFSDLSAVLPERYRHLSQGITMLYKLSDAVMDEILGWEQPGPTFSYYQHYRAVNAFLDSKALWVTTMLERMGYRALPIPASQSVKDMGFYSGAFQHKTAAVQAGMGWIGKSALFVSPLYGPRVRLVTVLTDMPLPVPADKAPLPGCGNCTACVNACPAGAISGRNYIPGNSREDIFSPKLCSEHMKKTYLHIGRGSVCGICAAVCPFGKHGNGSPPKP